MGSCAIATGQNGFFQEYGRRMTLGPIQLDRTISTGWLNVSQRLHLRPINLVVFEDSLGELISRGASHLDAFSGYPVRT